MLRYLKGALGLNMNLYVDDMSVINCSVDASYAAHEDCKGRKGVMMSLGQGAETIFSRNQKIQGKSSNKDDPIVVDDTLPQALWTKYFIEAWGCLVERNLINQDNKSATFMDTNGRFSSSKRTKHIKTRYFFVKDKVDKGGVEIQYCPAVAPFP